MNKHLAIFIPLSFLIVLFGKSIASDDNPHGDIKLDCEKCHNAADWKFRRSDIEFKHEETGYPLIGAHLKVECRSCHQSLVFSQTGVACIDCHTDIHAGEMGLDCQNCHTPASWENRSTVWEDHNLARFPLIGIHASLDCESCHRGPAEKQFTNLPVECEGCHRADFDNSRNPDHRLAGFPMQCETCHSPVSVVWQQVQYTHPGSFPLRGSHLNVACADCHTEKYAGTPNQCENCHMDDYLATTEPAHKEFGFPTVCANCHDEFRWEDASFDHTAQAGFALVGAHSRILCVDCHVNNQITSLPRDCYGCHQADFTATADPNHVTNNFSHDCLTCHSQETWSPSTIDHNNTMFPLTGAHMTVACISCHESGYAGTPTNCYACHDQDFAAVQDPSHVTNNFDHDCSVCHNTSVWSPANFDHNNTTFELTGAHMTVACINCHANGYSGTSTDCYACHDQDFAGALDPNHGANNFDHDCTVCHNTSAWSPADFDHNNTAFPLTGTHLTTACNNCHQNGYANTPLECFACHETDYNGANDPNHITVGFPTTCEDCHNTVAWDQTTWDHDTQYFPIYSGSHRGRWNTCADCHLTPAQYQLFECIYCHEHNQTTMDEKHRERPDYQYLSTACYYCHPTGRAEGD